jgi:FkbM family methyltransferase
VIQIYILNFYQKINKIISYLFSNSLNEKKFLKSFFKSRKITYVDVGANLGSDYRLVKKITNLKECYLIEPSIFCYNYLRSSFSKNKNVFIYNIALSNVNDEKIFYEYNVKSQSSFYKLKKDNDKKNKSLFNVEKTYNIKALDLETFFQKNFIKSISYLKIDAQDEDLNILKGAKNLLKNKKIDLIKVEIAIKSNYASNFFGQDIISFLDKYNYKLINISNIKYEGALLSFFDGYFAFRK